MLRIPFLFFVAASVSCLNSYGQSQLNPHPELPLQLFCETIYSDQLGTAKIGMSDGGVSLSSTKVNSALVNFGHIGRAPVNVLVSLNPAGTVTRHSKEGASFLYHTYFLIFTHIDSPKTPSSYEGSKVISIPRARHAELVEGPRQVIFEVLYHPFGYVEVAEIKHINEAWNTKPISISGAILDLNWDYTYLDHDGEKVTLTFHSKVDFTKAEENPPSAGQISLTNLGL